MIIQKLVGVIFCNKEVRHGVVKMILQKIVGFDF